MLIMLLACWVGRLLADNFTMGNVLLVPGESQQVEISLANSTKYTAFQFDMVLPEGVRVANAEGKVLIASLNSDRVIDHQLHVAEVKARTYRFLAFSMSNADFAGM